MEKASFKFQPYILQGGKLFMLQGTMGAQNKSLTSNGFYPNAIKYCIQPTGGKKGATFFKHALKKKYFLEFQQETKDNLLGFSIGRLKKQKHS